MVRWRLLIKLEMKQHESSGYVTRRELAALLNLTPRCILHLVQRNQIPVIKLSKRKHLFEVEAVKDAIKRHETPALHGDQYDA